MNIKETGFPLGPGESWLLPGRIITAMSDNAQPIYINFRDSDDGYFLGIYWQIEEHWEGVLVGPIWKKTK